MSGGNDDEFDELFSFGAGSGGGTPTAAAKKQESDDIDFDLDEGADVAGRGPNKSATSVDDDDFLAELSEPSTPSAPKAAPATGSIEEDLFGDLDDGEDTAAAPPRTSTTAADRSMEEDLLFSDSPSPVAANATQEPSRLVAVSKGEEPRVSPPPRASETPVRAERQRLPSKADDEFHKFDSDAREMLDFLDDSGDGSTPRTSSTSATSSTNHVPSSSPPVSLADLVGENRPASTPGPSEEAFDLDREMQPGGNRTVPVDPAAASKDSTAAPASGASLPAPSGPMAALKRAVSGAGAPSTPPRLSALPLKRSQTAGEHPANAADLSPTIAVLPPQRPSSSNLAPSDTPELPGSDANQASGTKQETPAAPPIVVFDSLADAIRSSASTQDQIRELWAAEGCGFADSEKDRPHFWSKVVCGRPLQHILASSVADSFDKWCRKTDEEQLAQVLGMRNKRSSSNNSDESNAEDGKEQDATLEGEGELKGDTSDDFVTRLDETSDVLAAQISAFLQKQNEDQAKEREVKAEETPEKKGNLEETSSADDKDGDAKTETIDIEIPPIDFSSGAVRRALRSILLFHHENQLKSREAYQREDVSEVGKLLRESNSDWDPLLPPVCAVVLSAGVPVAAASVVLASVVPHSIPLMGLTVRERWDATKALHYHLYQLACYHLPLLVMHLDRYLPGWYWPSAVEGMKPPRPIKGDEDEEEYEEEKDKQPVNPHSQDDPDNPTKKSRDLESRGTIPASWFMSNFCDTNAESRMPDLDVMLPLWDKLLGNADNSLKFFLILTLLQRNSDTLLMRRSDDLVAELRRVFSVRRSSDENGDASENNGDVGADLIVASESDFLTSWLDGARLLSESTPTSVVDRLRRAEDEGVRKALVRRERLREERAKEQREAESKAQRAMAEEELARKERANRKAIMRGRLINFYQRNNPERVQTVDTILDVYEERYEILDKKLRNKYGMGFIPAIPTINPQLSLGANRLLNTMNKGMQGIQTTRKQIKLPRFRRRRDPEWTGPSEERVAVTVTADDVMPVVCSGRASRGEGIADEYAAIFPELETPVPVSVTASNGSNEPLRFFLVDSRPDATTSEQGRFPTAIRLSPEAHMDPDRIQQYVEMFESLRGAVHICVMGEGFSAFPALYSHKLSEAEQELADQDESRTNLCALFFIKKGFPFVSILDGGFAAAHAWLSRQDEKISSNLSSFLADYDEDISLYAELEAAYKEQMELADASRRERTARALQKIIEVSATRVTMSEQRIELLASELATQEGRQKVKDSVTNFMPTFSIPTTMTMPSLPQMPTLPTIQTPNVVLGPGSGEDASTAATEANPGEDGGASTMATMDRLNAAVAGFRNPFAQATWSNEDIGKKEDGNSAEHSTNKGLNSFLAMTSRKIPEGKKDGEGEVVSEEGKGGGLAQKIGNPFAGFGRAPEAVADSSGGDKKGTEALHISNPFAGFGKKVADATANGMGATVSNDTASERNVAMMANAFAGFGRIGQPAGTNMTSPEKKNGGEVPNFQNMFGRNPFSKKTEDNLLPVETSLPTASQTEGGNLGDEGQKNSPPRPRAALPIPATFRWGVQLGGKKEEETNEGGDGGRGAVLPFHALASFSSGTDFSASEESISFGDQGNDVLASSPSAKNNSVAPTQLFPVVSADAVAPPSVPLFPVTSGAPPEVKDANLVLDMVDDGEEGGIVIPVEEETGNGASIAFV